ncbi:MAG: tRNA preQ1(34) S-adenosylmethionine ribosyltransferase-isomerase QueA [Myxococcales bacterium]|nr:tRNA preQ1(34) S-adenosylmethionine ribosyltransferase-isomerase QueA [Myxococcales bacterium]
MRVDLLDFELPPHLIAQRPAETRDGARLLHLAPGGGLEDRRVVDLPALLPQGALLVVNDTQVIPSRLLGHREPSGGAVELLLLRRREGPGERWLCLGWSSKPLRPGTKLMLGEESIEAEIEAVEGEGILCVSLRTRDREPLLQVLDRVGHMPLPPYVERADDLEDRVRYQTVFAKNPGSAAAPTAGLHLSERLLEELRGRGCEVAAVTLHVGLGTFRPVKVDDLDQHPMHEEWCEVPEATVEAVRRAKGRGSPVVAVGTTVVRTLEAAALEGELKSGSRSTRLLIQPGFRFQVVDRLFTNFHLPRSTLLALVGAFGGLDRVLAAYRHAIAKEYRFFSYGDAMLLSERAG